MRRLLLVLLVFCPALTAQDDPEIEIGEAPSAEDEPSGTPEPPPRLPPGEGKVEPKASLQERINLAIDKGVLWLKQRQGKDGSYGPCISGGQYDGPRGDREAYRIGPTVFAVFTLRKCGVPRTDRTIKAALKWIRKRARKGWNREVDRKGREQFVGKTYAYSSYESAAVIMMLAALNRKDARPGRKPKPVRMSRSVKTPSPGFKKDEWLWMHERVEFLIRNSHPKMNAVQKKGGGWRYWPNQRTVDEDLSATQFALLGLRAAVEAGYPVHLVQPQTWEWAAKFAGDVQQGNGAFCYQRQSPWTSGMTAAGIASLLICKEQITNMGGQVPGWIDARVEEGLGFLGDHLDFTRNTRDPNKKAEGGGYHYYHLYGIERVGALSGKHEIGGKAWYPRGAKWLVEQQQAEGAWSDNTCMRPRDVLGTCFALLFLKKATPPAVTYSGD